MVSGFGSETAGGYILSSRIYLSYYLGISTGEGVNGFYTSTGTLRLALFDVWSAVYEAFSYSFLTAGC
jgi:hypothetical protein